MQEIELYHNVSFQRFDYLERKVFLIFWCFLYNRGESFFKESIEKKEHETMKKRHFLQLDVWLTVGLACGKIRGEGNVVEK